MSKVETLRAAIKRFSPGKVFGYSNLSDLQMKHSAMVVEVNELVRKGELIRVMRGRFIVAGSGKELLSPKEIIGAICNYRNRVCGYETGPSVWESWGLLPVSKNRKEYYISIMQMRPAQKHSNITVRFKRSRLDPANYNHEILQFLDAFESINSIVGVSGSAKFFETMQNVFNSWNESARLQLSSYALAYRPGTRALIGAFLQQMGYNEVSGRLSATLHPASTYVVHINEKYLPFASQWKILCREPQKILPAHKPRKKN